MTILVTGARGSLGKQIVTLLTELEFEVVPYSHTQSVKDVSWHKIETVINCAAAIPCEGVSGDKYFNANVRFIEELLPFCSGKKFIHFSTLSQLYKHESYQRSKMLGDLLLVINKHLFKDLHLVHLPTIEDCQIIDSICRRAIAGEKPKVDHLKYNYMPFEDIAKYVADNVNDNSWPPISEYFQAKDLYNEVCALIPSELIKEGDLIDRVLMSESTFYVHPNLAREF